MSKDCKEFESSFEDVIESRKFVKGILNNIIDNFEVIMKLKLIKRELWFKYIEKSQFWSLSII